MVTAGYSPTTEQLLLLALWLLVLPIVIPIITGGISSWYIDGMRVYGGILLGIPVGIANIFWSLVWASAFGGGLDELYRAIPLEDRPTRVVMWTVGMILMIAFMVGLMLLVGGFLRKGKGESSGELLQR